MKKRKLRKKIARDVVDKMERTYNCRNAIDIVANIILSKKDRYIWNSHCNGDCEDRSCRCNYKYRDNGRWYVKNGVD